MLARFFSFLMISALVAFVLAAALPGPHRIAFPGAYGLTEVSDGVWTDAPERADALRATANEARRNVQDFFDGPLRKPTLVLCATTACAEDFGIGGNGLSVAHLGILVSPGGLTEGTLTHEMTHFRLHRSMGVRNIWAQPYPTWFDEGLATHVANHPRWSGEITQAARAQIRKVDRFWKLRGAFEELGVGRTYRAAADEVATIEGRVGRDGLLELINRAEAGEDFDALLIEMGTR